MTHCFRSIAAFSHRTSYFHGPQQPVRCSKRALAHVRISHKRSYGYWHQIWYGRGHRGTQAQCVGLCRRASPHSDNADPTQCLDDLGGTDEKTASVALHETGVLVQILSKFSLYAEASCHEVTVLASIFALVFGRKEALYVLVVQFALLRLLLLLKNLGRE